MSGTVSPGQYTSLITAEHQNQPAFAAAVLASVQPFVDMQNLCTTLTTQTFDLDTAVGAQLDAVGVRIGFSRYLEVPITGGFFSWDTVGLGWDQGYWQGQFALGEQQIALDDSTYRIMLRLKVAANHWDGTNQTYLNLFPTALMPSTNSIQILDNQNMTITVLVTGPQLPPFLANLLTNGVAVYRPAGTTLTYVFQTATAAGASLPHTVPNTVPQ